MKTTLFSLVAAFGLAAFLPAQDAKPAPTAAELETKFKETLTSCTMSGHSCTVKDGQLGPERADQYHIVSVEKSGGDNWIINARMKYGKQEIVVPIPVQVKWAGDTAVIIVDDLRIPGAAGYSNSAYTARVLIHGNTYAGTWSGGDHGGMLNGLIGPDKTINPEAK
jgi:hypothetical protein